MTTQVTVFEKLFPAKKGGPVDYATFKLAVYERDKPTQVTPIVPTGSGGYPNVYLFDFGGGYVRTTAAGRGTDERWMDVFGTYEVWV